MRSALCAAGQGRWARPLSGLLILSVLLFLNGCAEPVPGLAEGGNDNSGGGGLSFNQDQYNAASAVQGGLLYDKWWDTSSSYSTPGSVHPLWPQSTSYSSASDTWRCKNCHGWDYRGGDGINGSASGGVPTNIKGVVPTTSYPTDFTTPEELFDFLANDPQHGFSDQLSTSDLYSLTRFVVTLRQRAGIQQLPYNKIDDGGAANGNNGIGANLYANAKGADTGSTACVDCHSSDGTGMLEAGESLGALADENPWEFAHKALFGHPGSQPTMPALLSANSYGTAFDYAIDILAYAQQSLPSSGGSGGGSGGGTGTSSFDPARYNGSASVVNADLIRGGLLYDEWWAADSAYDPVNETHPLWPSSNTAITGSATWRCKNCHGWDYRGADGVYGTGDHATGLRGIISTASFTMERTTAEQVFAFLETNSSHAFGTRLTTEDLYALTRFVMTIRDQANGSNLSFNFIDDATKSVNGDGGAGANFYANENSQVTGNTSCSACHGSDGSTYLEPDEPLPVIAKENPWELVHKALFGHPGSSPRMPALLTPNDYSTALDIAVDISAYAQTTMVPDPVRGGRLYDEWWVVSDGATKPGAPFDLYTQEAADPTKYPNAPENTWRCKECHGWDYKGANGAYDQNSSHYTGFQGVLNLTQIQPNANQTLVEALVEFLSTDSVTVTVNGTQYPHNFGGTNGPLSPRDINDLAAFLTNPDQGVQDLSDNVAQASATTGDTVYHAAPGNCVACHGATGTDIASVDLLTIAQQNPEEFMHKARFGQPDSGVMIPNQNQFSYEGVSAQQAADILAYVTSSSFGNSSGGGSGGGGGSTTPGSDLIAGGLLYDEWWVAQAADPATATAPSGRNPLFTILEQNGEVNGTGVSDSSTWRCKQCHGWDYRAKGLNVNSPTANLRQLANSYGLADSATQASIRTRIEAQITSGFPIRDPANPGQVIQVHNYGDKTGVSLSANSVQQLVTFVLDGGIIDTTQYIRDTGGFALATATDPQHGEDLFTGTGTHAASDNCQRCHGADGASLTENPNLDILQLSVDDPWEVLHKARVGMPGTAMPGLLDLTDTNGQPLGNHEAADVLRYLQDRQRGVFPAP